MNNTFDVRVYPIEDPKGSTLAFANVTFKADGEDFAAICGIRVMDSTNGLFVSMPKSKDKDGGFHDIAFPLSKELRLELNTAVLGEYETQARLEAGQRGYEKPEPSQTSSLCADDVALDVRVFPIKEPQGSTLAFASIGFSVGGEDLLAIRGIRVVDSEKGVFVSMPQSKGSDGDYHDVAFPLSGDLRKALNKSVLAEYDKHGERAHTDEEDAGGKERSSPRAARARRPAAVKG